MKFQYFSYEQKYKVLLDTYNFIKEMKDVFDIDCFLCGGVLLGSQREKDLIKHDQDIDIYYISKTKCPLSKESKKEENDIWNYFDSTNRAKKRFSNKSGVQLHMWFNEQQKNYGNPGKTNMIDIFGSWINEKSCVMSGNCRIYESKIKDLILPLQTMFFFDLEFNIPNKTEEFLDFFYGYCWKDSFIAPKFPPGEIEQAIEDGILWEYWRGNDNKIKKLTGFGRKKLGYIKLNNNGTVEWNDNLHKFWKLQNNNIILYKKNVEYVLYNVNENEYETIKDDIHIKIKKITKNSDPSAHIYYDSKICQNWFKKKYEK